MGMSLASILVNIDVTAGATAIDYSAGACPVLSFHCIGSSGSGNVKLTPYNATRATLSAASGSGARLRITTGGAGDITGVEIASAGSGYPVGPISVTISDKYGSGGVIGCTAGAGGTVTQVSVTSAGTGYSGYILFDVNDFIEGVTYEILPRYIEQTSGSGVLRLIGYKTGFVPLQQY